MKFINKNTIVSGIHFISLTVKVLTFFALFLIGFHVEKPLAEEPVTFCAVGDILLDRGIRTKIRKHGVEYPFKKTAELINSYDLAFCNLECPLSKRGHPLVKTYAFRGDSSYVQGLKFSGFNIFCLANNHVLDHGREALLDTKEILERDGFYTVGADSSQKKASEARIIKKGGVTFAFLAYVSVPLVGITYSVNLPGPARADTNRIVQEIRSVRNRADFIIVSFHWGPEFSPSPSKKQREFAHRAIDSGADLIIGHHPHVIQSIEKYKERFIIYSLGNFIFDQHKLVRREGIVFGCAFENDKIVSPHIVPIRLEKFQPHIAQGEDQKRIVKRIKSLSKEYGVSFKESGDRLLLE